MVAPTGNANYGQIQATINKLQAENKTNYNQLMTYVLNPYISQLSYDIYNFDTTELDFDNGNIHIKISDKISVTFTLDESIEYTLAASESDKILLYFDFDESTFSLKFKVLGAWQTVETVKFVSPITEGASAPALSKEENAKFVKINSYINRAEVLGQHKSKGERFFTEAVVDGLLDKGEWNNEFLRTSLANELMNPSAEMVALLAARLVKDYTTQSEEKVAEKLKPILEEGLSGVVESIVETGILPTSSSSYRPAQVSVPIEKKEPSGIDAPVEVTPKESVKETFKNLGFGFGDKKEEEAEPKEKAHSEKPIEKQVSLEDLVTKEEPKKPELSSDGSFSLDDML